MLRKLLHSIVAKPMVYDAVQRLAGIEELHRRIRPVMAQVAGQVVLDIGAGTGLNLSVFPDTAKYLWLDNDSEKYQGFRQRNGLDYIALLGDATAMGLSDQSVDYVTCTAVTHHLTDVQLASFMRETARVARKKLILIDGLATDRWISKLMWRYDRGSNPRTEHKLLEAIKTAFTIEHCESFAIYHRYLIVVATPLGNVNP